MARAFRPLGMLRAVLRGYVADDGFTWASATAFYLVLSLPPLLIAAGAIAIRVVGEQAAVDFVLDQVADLLPAERALVERVVEGAVSGSDLAGLLSLPLLLVTGSRVFGTLILAIEGIWDVREHGRFVRRQLLRLALLSGAGVLVAVSAVIDFGVMTVAEATGAADGVRWALTSQLVPVVFLLAALVALYRLVPPGAAGWRATAWGAVFATVLLRLAQFLFSGYLQNVADFGTAYGPLASVAVLMTWALLASSAVILGAELVVMLERPSRRAALGHGQPGTAGRRGRTGVARDGDDAPAPEAERAA